MFGKHLLTWLAYLILEYVWIKAEKVSLNSVVAAENYEAENNTAEEYTTGAEEQKFAIFGKLIYTVILTNKLSIILINQLSIISINQLSIILINQLFYTK